MFILLNIFRLTCNKCISIRMDCFMRFLRNKPCVIFFLHNIPLHFMIKCMKKRIPHILLLIKADLHKNYIMLLTVLAAWFLIRLLTHAFCPSVIFCGLPCPGCGLTRASLALLQLDPVTAWERNPAIYPWGILLVSAAIQRYIRETPLKDLYPLLLLVALLTLGIYVYRMLCLFPGERPLIYRDGNLMAKIHPAYDAWMKAHIPPPYK